MRKRRAAAKHAGPADGDDRPAMLFAEFPVEIERQMRALDGTLYDVGATDAPADAEEVFAITITSDTPVDFPGGQLILSHEPGAIDMRLASQGLSFLLEHGGENAPYRIDPEMHVGVVRDVKQETHRTRGLVSFLDSGLAPQIRADFRKQGRPWISAGWLPLAKPVLVRAGQGDRPDLWKMPKWRLCEASSVSVPADPTARVAYSAWGFGNPAGDSGAKPTMEEEDPMKKKVLSELGTVIEVEDSDPRQALSETQLRSLEGMVRGGDDPTRGAAVAERQKEINQIVELCTAHKLESRAGEFIAAGLNLEQVKGKILDIRSTAGDFNGSPAAERLVPLTRKEAESYSVTRAVMCAMALRGESGFKFHGLEADVHREIERQAKVAQQQGGSIITRGGVFIPMRVHDAVRGDEKLFARVGGDERALQVRAATSLGPSIPTGGAELVPNTLLDMIDILRNNSVCAALGARTLPGVVGTVTWPRVKADPTVRWMATNPGSGAAASAPSYGWVMSSPKTLIGNIIYPRQLQNVVNFDIENDMRGRLGEGHGLAWDLGGIAGPGTDGQPVGIVYNPDVQSLPMGNTIPTYKLLTQAIGMTRKKNFRGQSLGWALTPEMAAVLAATPRVSGAGATDFIYQGPIGEGTMAGYRALDSNQLPISGSDHELILGAWSNMVFPLWGAMEITVDPYTYADFGQLRITSFQMGDVVNQRPEGFVRCTGARLA